MPNVTIYIPANKMPTEEILAELTEQCTELCTRVLKAALVNVHIVYVAVRHGRGHPAFAEIQYRHELFRTPQMMQQFMEQLELSIRHITHLTARIRCFEYNATSIYARN